MFNSIINSLSNLLSRWKRKVDSNDNYIADKSESLKDPQSGDTLDTFLLLQYGGPIVTNLKTNENVSIGDVLYLNNLTGYLSKANSKDTNHVDFIALESKDGTITPVTIKCIPSGNIAPSNTTFNSSDIGSPIYLSDINSGKYIVNDFNSNYNIIRIGFVNSTDSINFKPSIVQDIYIGNIGVIAGGSTDPWLNSAELSQLEYLLITNQSNSKLWGYLTTKNRSMATGSNGYYNRGFIGGGIIDESTTLSSIYYINITNESSVAFFGSMTNNRTTIGTDNGTNNRGLIGAGVISWPNAVSTIEYITISQQSNSTFFGNISYGDLNGHAFTSNDINNRGIIAGSYDPDNVIRLNNINYITITSLGNSIDFGDLSIGSSSFTAISNGVFNRAIFSNPYTTVNTNFIWYINIMILGNSQDFGQRSLTVRNPSSLSNKTGNIGLIMGGTADSIYCYNNIDYINISQLGNSNDFADMLTGKVESRTMSNA